MSQENKVSAVLDAEVKSAVLQNIASIREQLKNILVVSLNPDERQGLAKMGDKSLAFVEKALDYAAKNAELVPPYLNLTEAQADYNLAANLRELARELGTLNQAIDDMVMLAGSEAYDAALIFHASVKGASRTNQPGTQAIYEDLVQRFPRGGRTKPAGTVSTAAA